MWLCEFPALSGHDHPKTMSLILESCTLYNNFLTEINFAICPCSPRSSRTSLYVHNMYLSKHNCTFPVCAVTCYWILISFCHSGFLILLGFQALKDIQIDTIMKSKVHKRKKN